MTDPFIRVINKFGERMDCGCCWPMCRCDVCPWCEEKIASPYLEECHEGEESFCIDCPHCEKPLEIGVEFELRFNVEKDNGND